MKMALIGSGVIIHDAVYALKYVDSIEIKAIYVREHSLDKGLKLSKECGLDTDGVYTNYEMMLDSADIDCVYIGLVNSAHFEFAKTALLHKKHVIVEKPFTQDYEKAKELYDLAKEKSLMIFEAINILHSEAFNTLSSTLRDLGKIKLVNANFSQYSSAYDRYLSGDVAHSFDKAFFGGAMRDLNLYNLHYTVALFGLPLKAKYYANKGFNGVDTSGVLILIYSELTCVLTCAKDSDSDCYYSIQGEKGFIKIDCKPNVASTVKIVTVKDSGETTRDEAGATVRDCSCTYIKAKPCPHRLCNEFKDFADMIDNNDFKRAEFFMKETLDVMKVIDMINNDL